MEAIFHEDNLPDEWKDFTALNAEEAPKFPVITEKKDVARRLGLHQESLIRARRNRSDDRRKTKGTVKMPPFCRGLSKWPVLLELEGRPGGFEVGPGRPRVTGRGSKFSGSGRPTGLRRRLRVIILTRTCLLTWLVTVDTLPSALRKLTIPGCLLIQ